VKKDTIRLTTKNTLLNVPETNGESKSVMSQIIDNSKIQRSRSSTNIIAPRSVHSQLSFKTDISVLKNKNNGEKTK
jgi:hypothetical protein